MFSPFYIEQPLHCLINIKWKKVPIKAKSVWKKSNPNVLVEYLIPNWFPLCCYNNLHSSVGFPILGGIVVGIHTHLATRVLVRSCIDDRREGLGQFNWHSGAKVTVLFRPLKFLHSILGKAGLYGRHLTAVFILEWIWTSLF